jgi:putative hydrolase of the HAD superfamily
VPTRDVPNEPPRAVVFDFGGVLAEEGFRNGLLAIARRHGADPERFFADAVASVHDTGYLTGTGGEADFWGRLRAHFPGLGGDAELRAELLSRFVLRPRMLEVVHALRRKGVRTAILSDQTDWLEELERRERFFSLFDAVFNSFRMGRSKRDPAVFDHVARELRLAPDEILFTDDSPGNVQRAQSRGLRTLLFTDEASFLLEVARVFPPSPADEPGREP